MRVLGLRGAFGTCVMIGLAAVALTAAARAQNESGGLDAGGCTLKDHVYTCDGAKFHQALESAQTAAIQAHNSDGVARSQLTDLVTRKLHKTVAPSGTQADLVFLLIPVKTQGIVDGAVNSDLGTLRVYSSTADGRPEHLLWAETYAGMPDLPWPAVVRQLISQFQARFKIK